ncbi:Chromosome segregation ATPase Smc (Smc) [Fructobacillus tropaeoli]|uniref:Chromosome partition protein Smc n=1 Tax=Fructobacillus tropaeoli TaxID=709323 RepID=A0ABN9YNC5_9LACO|nr:Chromosome segregation ATPase Smc (Smc) [Fructobacillus tropaeoli]CAK1238013.1 Chromosome segregation ATPase Smc (Smc) [Fructobacillus tropaeoli]
MKLKTLEIIGFKSFANKTVIDFQQGMTGIVGPNGSGKSNIIEAIRWVMGEQSAKDLRGNKMADVIFGGTKNRKPLNRAEVSITFDNADHYIASDFIEIRITRRLYRTGESSYQLNGTECRLKDIHELFMDTGLGRDGFSIISQGQVEKIFSAKPEERRGIIEEVAGVYKYKQNKDKAEKDLAATEDNLDRVDDIIAEVEGRLTPLADQALKAKDYLAKRESFEKLDQVRLTRSILSLQGQVADQSQEAGKTKEAVAKQQAQVSSIQDGLSQTRSQLEAIQHDRDALQAEIVAKTQEKERLIGNQKLASQEQATLVRDLAHLAEQQKDDQAQVEETQADLTQVQGQLTALVNQERSLKQTIKQIDQDHGATKVDAVQNELAENRNAYVATMQEIASLHNKLTYQEKALAQTEAQLALKKTAMTKAQGDLDAAESALAAYQKEHPDQTTGENPFEAQVAQAEDALADAKTTAQDQQKSWQEAAYALDQQRSRYQAEASLDDYAGFYQGVKNLMVPAVRRNFPGIKGVVAELLTVPKSYTKAIETVLGGALQQIVVDSTQTAKSIVAYLTKNKKGRVTLLPIDTIRPRQARDVAAASRENGYIGLAADLVSVPVGMENILSSLLGTTLVVENLDAATRVARACQNRLRVVSLDGQLVNAGGSITGGANFRQGPSVLSRQADLKEKEAALVKQQALVDDLAEKRSQSQNQVNTWQEKLADLMQKSRDFVAQGQQVDYELASLKDTVDRHQTSVQTLSLDLADLQVAKEDAEQEQTMAQAALTENEDKKGQIEGQTADLTAELDHLTKDQQAYQDQKAEFQAELAKVSAQRAAQEENQNRLTEALTKVQEHLLSLQEQAAQMQESLDQAKSAEELSQAVTDLSTALTEAQEKADSLAEQWTKLSATVKEEEEKLALAQEELNNEVVDQSAANHRLQSSQERLAKQIATLRQTYGLTVESEDDVVASDLSDQEIDQTLAETKKAIDALGPVNIAAIQEYDEIKDRHDFLTNQAEDLKAAKQTLQDTIDEMDQEVQIRFKETFDAIAANFSDVFTKMFAGGQAQIELTDPEHLLTTGIDIKAQPPGKKFQQMSLLSGGEKALTAISLLFAILQVRPVPFAVLDEAEAALDEANVDRFAAYLKNFAGDTQFITITHRKGTMVAAKILYGVTMQEAGVSKMVAVNLEEAHQQLA